MARAAAASAAVAGRSFGRRHRLPAGPHYPEAALLARDVLGMSRAEFSAAYKGSPMKRAKLRGLKRNTAVMLGNVGAPEDAGVLARALGDAEPLVRAHAAWALDRLGAATLDDG